MKTYKLETQRILFLQSESHLDENNKQKLTTTLLNNVTEIMYCGDSVEITNNNYEISKEIGKFNIGDIYYGSPKHINFILGNGVNNKIYIFGDPYWKLYELDENSKETLIAQHECKKSYNEYENIINE